MFLQAPSEIYLGRGLLTPSGYSAKTICKKKHIRNAKKT